jgi:MIP family channel proteins
MPESKTPSAFVAEFVGTALLTMFIAMVVSVYQPDAGVGFVDFSIVGLLHAFVLLMLVATLGGVSGGHFNPAVTCMLAALRRIRPADAGVYVVLQCAGAIVGALLCKALLDEPGKAVSYGAGVPSDIIDGSMWRAALGEGLGVFALGFAIMGVAVNPQGNERLAPVAIGVTLGFAVFVMGPLTGGALNPARELGPVVVTGFDVPGLSVGDVLVAYTLGPLLGGLAAGFLYDTTVLAPQRLELERPVDTLDDTIPTP